MADVQFDPASVVRVASEILSVKRVFGEPFECDGVTIIPVAKVMGGSGGGGGQDAGPRYPRDGNDDADGWTGRGGSSGASATDSGDAEVCALWQTPATGSGGGSGLGVHVRPIGVYLVDSHGVHWHPALDVNRVILGGQVLAALVVLAVARVLRGRR